MASVLVEASWLSEVRALPWSISAAEKSDSLGTARTEPKKRHSAKNSQEFLVITAMVMVSGYP